jgi:hypothetical protein
MSQHMEALARGNEIRCARAQLKREIKAREILVAELLREEIPDWLRSERVDRLLGAIPGMGVHRIRTMLRQIPVGEIRTVGNLTPREKAALVLALNQKPFCRRPG